MANRDRDPRELRIVDDACLSERDRRESGETHAQVGVLGPILVEVDGLPRPTTARRQRAVLAYLALHAGEAVSADRLLDAVWGDDLPDTGTRTIAYQISRGCAAVSSPTAAGKAR